MQFQIPLTIKDIGIDEKLGDTIDLDVDFVNQNGEQGKSCKPYFQ